jgi:hypothetical protein
MRVTLVLVLLLAGCVGKYVHPTKDHAAYEHDITYCRADATAAAMMTDPAYQGYVMAARLGNCMKKRGWVRE